MGEKIESYLAGNAESIADMASDLGDQAKDVFGREAGQHRIEYGKPSKGEFRPASLHR